MEKQQSKSKKEKCRYCGNNPTNHTISFIAQTISVPITPIVRALSSFKTPILDKIAGMIIAPYLWVFRKIGLWGVNNDPEKAFTDRSRVVWLEAEKRGIKMEQFVIFRKPVEQYRAKIKGRWRYFESLPIPRELEMTSYSWMDDKELLKKKFLKENIPVAKGGSAITYKKALDIFNKIKKPVIIKPRLGSRGRHTTTYIYDKNDLKKGFNIAKQLCAFVVIEEHLKGSVYRGTYVGGEIVGILRGDPPRIKGDGINTIEKLIEEKNKNKNTKVKDVLINQNLIDFLERQNLSLDSIPSKGVEIDLSEKIGLSYGGNAIEELEKTHHKILAELKRAGDILNAPVIGFDFIIDNVIDNPEGKHWGIIEANSLPFINLHHFPEEGEPKNVAGKIWDLWK